MEIEPAGFAPPLHFGGFAASVLVETSFLLDLITHYSSLTLQMFLLKLNQIKNNANGVC